MQLSLLARATVPIIERYYLAISLLLKAGSGRLSQEALERQCQLIAERMSLLYELHSPEFFDRSLFGIFLDLLRPRGVLETGADGRLVYELPVLEAIASTRSSCCTSRSVTASCRWCIAEAGRAHRVVVACQAARALVSPPSTA